MIRHRFVADPDWEPTYNLMPIQIRITDPTPSFKQVGNSTFIHINTSVPVEMFLFLVSVKGGKLFNNLDSIFKFAGKKYNIFLHLVEMNTIQIRIRQNNADIRPDPDSHH